MQIHSVGIDLGKTTFHLVALGAHGNLRISPLECGPASPLSNSAGPLVDTRNRDLRDLRISVTDRYVVYLSQRLARLFLRQ